MYHRVEDPLPDYLAVFVGKPGFVPQRAVWDFSAAPALPADFTLTLDPATSIGGRILDESAHPVEGAIVHLIISETEPRERGVVSTDLFDKTATTDADGRWRSREAPRNFTEVMFRLAHPDYVESLHFTKADIPRSVFCGKKSSGKCHAGCLWPARSSMPPASPFPCGDSARPGPGLFGRQTRLSRRLRRQILHAPRSRSARLLTVKAEGHGPALLQFTVAHEMPRLRIALPSARTLRGRVVDAGGMPLSGVHVFADTWRATSDPGMENADRRRWKIRVALRAGGRDPIRLLKKGFRAARRVPLTASDTEQVIVLRRPLRVRGTVRDAATQRNLSAFRVIPGSLLHQGQIHWVRNHAVACTDGAYEWSTEDSFAPDAALYLRIEADGYTSAARAIPDSGDAVTLDFVLQPGPPIEGLVLAPDGTPVAGRRW